MPADVPIDPAYLIDVLMRDLVGHDRAPSAYLVYLWLWRMSRGEGRERIGASLQTIANRTGLSKSAVQAAVRHLARRRLISAERERADRGAGLPGARAVAAAGADQRLSSSKLDPGRRMVAGLLAGRGRRGRRRRPSAASPRPG